jgi:hypothetical protein
LIIAINSHHCGASCISVNSPSLVEHAWMRAITSSALSQSAGRHHELSDRRRWGDGRRHPRRPAKAGR